ncbi:flagellar hook-associated protein FlgK [Pseudomonas sp. 1D4]|uniref:flagellar hook-associated protein FlgK n=1 Tax=Pseudomonadaceae TaxID=135621 RepID=UPI00084A7F02|nr:MULTISPECIES: flagellar hook-associated protein FlgK [Pseudomonas]OEC39388.1 flagellar hook-associated protein FlgK [Pseudomonas sp. 1D4]
MSLISQIALTGLQASQIALATTAQNTANRNTAGYSRLHAVLQSRMGPVAGQGGGVDVAAIRRIADGFQNQQLWRAGAEQQLHAGARPYFQAVESLVAGEGTSISTGLDRFFGAVSEASATPSSQALRQQLLVEAGNLAQRFNGLSSGLQNQLDGLMGQREALVTDINGITANLALLNRRIIETKALGGDVATLQDHRDEVVKALGQHVQLRTLETPDGAYDITLASGQPLVIGDTASHLEVVRDADNQQHIELQFAGTRAGLSPKGLGGTLGALHVTETQLLRPNQALLREMAGQFAEQVNDVLADGFDRQGNPGQALFRFEPGSVSQLLTLTGIGPDQLAFSDAPGEAGNNRTLLALYEVRRQPVVLGGSPTTFHDAYAGLVGQVASASRQNQDDLAAATEVTRQAQALRDGTSAVNGDEEAANLIAYQQAYQANMKVIATANTLFDAMLASF